MNRYYLLLSFVFLQGCAQEGYFGKLNYLGRFPSNLSEVSGIEIDSAQQLWVIEDNGNKDVLYEIDSTAKPLRKLKIENAKNNDWEDLAISKNGTLYIGDFGNNSNSRKNLVIYKITQNQLNKKTPEAKKIKFSYPEQKEYPPKNGKLLFDAEGFFHWENHLYIFTKNRSHPYSGQTLIYRVPDKKGSYEAELVGDLVLCADKDHCSITGADISEDGKTIALLGYGFVYLLSEFSLTDFSNTKIETIDLEYESQIEAVCFLDDTTLLIADEQSKTKGRNLYTFKLDK